MKAINDDSGKLYIFGGGADKFVGSPTKRWFNDMVIFNTVESSWIISTSVNAPTKRLSYTATLLSNGIIAYIGGYELIDINNEIRNVDIKQIDLYDTNSLIWSVKVCISK